MTPDTPIAPHILEEGVRLSESMIWSLQRGYYEDRGPAAWDLQGVPFFITSNGFIARAYARLVFHFLVDLHMRGSVEPVTVMELGAGHGRFGYLFLRHLDALLAEHAGPLPLVRLLMTDLVEANIEAWSHHVCLRPWLEQGRLQLARFDAENDDAPLLVAGPQAGAFFVPPGPLVVVSNYVFDSLVHDAWRVSQGRLMEGHAVVGLSDPEAGPPDLRDPELISRLFLDFTFQAPGEPPPSDILPVLDWYRDNLGDSAFLVPVGALRCLRSLGALCEGRPMLVLSSDKAWNHPHQLLRDRAPELVTHGSFSFIVNHDAIARWTVARGGQALLTTERGDTFATGLFVLNASFDDLPLTRMAFRAELEDFGPSDFVHVREAILHDSERSVATAVRLLRLSGWDGTTFLALCLGLQRAIAADPPKGASRDELAEVLERVGQHAFPVVPDEDVTFLVGQVLCDLEKYPSALVYFQRSLDIHGEHPATHHNMALCLNELERYDEALDHIDRTLAMDPESDEGRGLRLRLLASLERIARLRMPQ